MPTLLRGARLIDGTGAAGRPNAGILIDGERIERIVDATDFTPRTAP